MRALGPDWGTGRTAASPIQTRTRRPHHREPLALDEFDLEILQRLVIELELPLEGAIGHTAPLAQQRDHLIHHGDKVHLVSSLPGALPVGTCAAPS